jgi:hypothetical protein
MMHVIIGLFFIALGVWGVFDEWYYVVDFLKGSGSLFLIVAGMLAIFAGAVGPLGKREEDDLAEPSADEDGDDREQTEPAPEDASTDDD